MNSVYGPPAPAAISTPYDHLIDHLTEKLPAVAEHLADTRVDLLAFRGNMGWAGGY